MNDIAMLPETFKQPALSLTKGSNVQTACPEPDEGFKRSNAQSLDFVLPPELEAGEPPEARGLARDQVRLMVSYCSDDRVVHTRFRALPDFLAPGDLLVINTSGTLNAALEVTRADGTPLELHLSTRLPAGIWLVEVRQPDGRA
ncbi:MAG TPA: S-adenosylmethionine:tRNA ribosyltransferase-isomerase, partial [Roseiflexaceae bacterium]|nr:S-adenosylmethionine:tRNA ribosyltransferase-isomerase [Roseiflexaceae bacterium]